MLLFFYLVCRGAHRYLHVRTHPYPTRRASKLVRQGAADPQAKVLVIYGDGRPFMAGADIREFGKPPLPPPLGVVINEIEACAKPTVAAIHGTAQIGRAHV